MATSVNLQNVIAALFGLSAGDSSDVLKFGVVTIDGKKWSIVEDGFDVPLDKIKGKDVEITASPRSFKFTFTGEQMLDERYPVSDEELMEEETNKIKDKVKKEIEEGKISDYSKTDDEHRTSASE